jgi:hypothetical protein
LHHFSKIKSSKDVTKRQKSRFFLLFLLDDRRMMKDPDPYLWQMDPDPGGPTCGSSGSDPDSDLDTEHNSQVSQLSHENYEVKF